MKELVLTGFPPFWPEDESRAIFLGPWCFAHNRKYQFWEYPNFVLAPSPWKDWTDVLAASQYIDSLVERLTPALAIAMNDLHQVSRSDRYWKLRTIVWMVTWLGQCYDRYRRLEYAAGQTKEDLKVRMAPSTTVSGRDHEDYMRQALEDHRYNLVLMSDIIRIARFKGFLPDETAIRNDQWTVRPRVSERSRRSLVRTAGGRFKQFLLAWLTDHLSSSAYLGSVYGLSIVDKLYLLLRYDPSHLFNGHSDRLLPQQGDRDRLVAKELRFEPQNGFEGVVREVLLKYVPDSLLTYYGRRGDAKKAVRVWIGNDIYTSDLCSHRIAEVCDNGGRWISSQHGGGYGQALSFPVGKIEYDSSYGFITWGWRGQHIYPCCYYPLPSPMLSKLGQHKGGTKLVLVGTVHPVYLYHLHSKLRPEDLLAYLENKRRFLDHLTEQVREEVIYRPYQQDYGTAEREFLAGSLPEHHFFRKGKLARVLSKARLVVVDHMDTTLLESFAMNVPTILFWQPEHFVATPFADRYFEKLRDGGILFDGPEEAAAKVNEVWEDVAGWWRSAEVQAAKDEFCSQFALTSRHWRKEWINFLKSLDEVCEGRRTRLSAGRTA